MNSESSDSWAANGAGYYLTARLLWDVSEAANATAVLDDFVARAFGDAAAPMRELYFYLNESHGHFMTNEDLLAKMYRRLDDAYGLTQDPAVIARLDELVCYTHYLELLFAWEQDRHSQEHVEALYRHAYRMRDTMMVHLRALWRDLRRRSNADIPADTEPSSLHVGLLGQDYEPWMTTEPFTAAEIASILAAGIANNQELVLPFTPVTFGEALVPAIDYLTLPNVSDTDNGSFNNGFRGSKWMFTWFRPGQSVLDLTVRGGMITHYQDRGNVRFSLYSPQEVSPEPVATDESVPPNNTDYHITLESPYTELHTLEWSDGGDLTRVLWAHGWPMTLKMTIDDQQRPHHRWHAYFYVPKGTEIVGGYATSNDGLIRDGAGNTAFSFDTMSEPGFFAVTVPPGQDGTLWKMHDVSGARPLMTVPPYYARNELELLLPIEVVQTDAQ